jgi:hypothetical protein
MLGDLNRFFESEMKYWCWLHDLLPSRFWFRESQLGHYGAERCKDCKAKNPPNTSSYEVSDPDSEVLGEKQSCDGCEQYRRGDATGGSADDSLP